MPPGDVEIHSELNDVPQPGYRGAKTTLIDREPSVTAARVARDRESTRAPARTESSPRSATRTIPARRPIFVTQNEISIGRGGEDLWVDLPLYASEEVSREHLRLRRDPASGAFTIVDKSRNGTWVNGRSLTRGVEERCRTAPKSAWPKSLKLSFEVRRMRELYHLHTPFVVAFLAFVVVFVLAHCGESGR